MGEPVRFCFGVHIHQPVGNFNHVFAEHVEQVYRPFLERCAARGFGPIALHVSGPLIEWLETHDRPFLDLVGRLASEGRLELLLAGYYEPVLASLPRPDRAMQISWMKAKLQSRFGVEATGLWLTERVWEPDLAFDLAQAGVRFVLVDDRHFLATGFSRDQLHQPWMTEHDGGRVMLFPIDERLRYLIPFRPPEETVTYLETLGRDGQRLAVLADDGEKFGGWPGTREWVYERGWLDRFLGAMEGATGRGTARLCAFEDALAEIPSGGLAYLPTASYREMEGWSLPAPAAQRLASLEEAIGKERLGGPDGALVRGAHWRNFLVKYPESNRMHKKMTALSALCRERGDPDEARRAIGRSQCNDAYWHGVFGGLYLPHLRHAVWRELARAEALLRPSEGLAAEVVDLDADGHDEVWIHSSRYSALVSPRRGGAVEELTYFQEGVNYADVLARRLEAYHLASRRKEETAGSPPGDGAPSIHDLEEFRTSPQRPPVDAHPRAIFQERLLDASVTREAFASGEFSAIRSWATEPFLARVEPLAAGLAVVLTGDGLNKALTFGPDGLLSASFAWDAPALKPGSFFSTELSLSRPLELAAVPAADPWRFPVATVSQSERGFSESVQGESVTFRWPVEAGSAQVRLDPVSHA